MPTNKVRILSLDGGGAKGFYTLGVLRQIEAMAGAPLHKHFRLIFGTSTGSIIAALLALGYKVEEIYALYCEHVPKIMGETTAAGRSAALQELADTVFEDKKFERFKTDVGIVSTNYETERPMIFKSASDQAFKTKESFVAGFGCTISNAVQASCSAYPFFNIKKVVTANDEHIELIDGGYCANNPTLYAIAEATGALKVAKDQLCVVSIGVGTYPPPKLRKLSKAWFMSLLPSVQLLQKTMEINTQSMDQLRKVLFDDVATVRIHQEFTQPELATDLLESDLEKLNKLWARGATSFRDHETKLKDFFA